MSRTLNLSIRKGDFSLCSSGHDGLQKKPRSHYVFDSAFARALARFPFRRHRDKAAECLDGVEGGHPPEHRVKGCDVVHGEEDCPRGGDGASEIAVAGHEEQKQGIDDVKRNHPQHESEAVGGNFGGDV